MFRIVSSEIQMPMLTPNNEYHNSQRHRFQMHYKLHIIEQYTKEHAQRIE